MQRYCSFLPKSNSYAKIAVNSERYDIEIRLVNDLNITFIDLNKQSHAVIRHSLNECPQHVYMIHFPMQKWAKTLLRVSWEVIRPPVISERSERTMRRSSAMRSPESWFSRPLMTR